MQFLLFRDVGYGWFPLSAAASVLVALVVPYIVAVKEGHVYPLLPYVSDTGALQPESCIFSQMLNVASALIGATIYLRYNQIADQCKEGPEKVLKWNAKSITPGYLAAVGLSVVANFQIDLDEDLETLQTNIHLTGSLMCFGLGIVYGYFQSRITYALKTGFWTSALALLRFALTALTGVFFITTFGYARVAFDEFNGTFAEHMHWRPRDGGYSPHILSAVSEYLMSFSYLLFILTFYKELKTMKPIGCLGGRESHRKTSVKSR